MFFISSKKSFQESGRRERMTSLVAGSRRTYTSEPSKRNSEGRRTAWLRPLRKSLAVFDMVYIIAYTILVIVKCNAYGTAKQENYCSAENATRSFATNSAGKNLDI